MTTITESQKLTAEIRRCTLCAGDFSHVPNPVFQFSEHARILIIGQAPGIKAHESNKPWNDASGDKLRSWLGVDREEFYSGLFAHMPMAFCFPGYKNGADAPPPKICAETWHASVIKQLNPALTIHIGRYSQQYYLPQFKTLTQAVEATTQSPGNRYVLPHPSGRNNRWLVRNPWFEARSLAVLRESVGALLKE